MSDHDKISVHEDSMRRELEASRQASDELAATLHLRLAALHQQQAEALRSQTGQVVSMMGARCA
jgi:hypothetical protein